MRWVHVSSSSTDLRNFYVFKVQRFPFYLRNYLSFSTENKQNPSPVVNTEKSRVQSTPDQVRGVGILASHRLYKPLKH